MLFPITFEINTYDGDTAEDRNTSNGALPPKEVTMLDHRHGDAGLGGFIVAESDRAAAKIHDTY
jgi:hypothetical protein